MTKKEGYSGEHYLWNYVVLNRDGDHCVRIPDAFEAVEIEHKMMIKKACKWLEENFIKECGYVGFSGSMIDFNVKPAIEAFKKSNGGVNYVLCIHTYFMVRIMFFYRNGRRLTY